MLPQKNILSFGVDAGNFITDLAAVQQALDSFNKTAGNVNLGQLDNMLSVSVGRMKKYTKEAKLGKDNEVLEPAEERLRKFVTTTTKSGQQVKFALDGLAEDFENTATIVNGSVQVINNAAKKASEAAKERAALDKLNYRLHKRLREQAAKELKRQQADVDAQAKQDLKSDQTNNKLRLRDSKLFWAGWKSEQDKADAKIKEARAAQNAQDKQDLKSDQTNNKLRLNEQKLFWNTWASQQAKADAEARQLLAGKYTDFFNKKNNITNLNPGDKAQLSSAIKGMTDIIRTTDIAQSRFNQIYQETKKGNFLTQLTADEEKARQAVLKYLKALKQIDDRNSKLTSEDKRRAKSQRFTEATTDTGNLLARALPGGLGGATPEALSRIAAIRRSLESLLATGDLTKVKMNLMFDQIRAGATDLGQLTSAERAAEIQLRRLAKTMTELGTAGKRTQDILISWKGMLRLFAVQQLHLAISNLTFGVFRFNDAAVEFEKRIGLIQTISQNASRSTEQWSRALYDLSTQFNVDNIDAAEAAYEALSNQIAEGAQILPFLSTAFKFAETTGSKAMDATNLFSSAILGYGKSAIEAENISSALFKTIDLGRVRVEQIADTLGNTAPMAQALGIRMEELLGTFALLTQKGIRPDTALTLLNNVMLSLMKPSEEFSNLMLSWGVSSGEAAIGAYNLTGVLKLLDKEFQAGGLSRIADIAKNMRTIRAEAGILAGSGIGGLMDTIGEFNENLDVNDKAFKIMDENLGVKYQRTMKSLVNVTQEVFGRGLVENTVRFFDIVGDADEALKPIYNTILRTLNVFTDFTAVITKVTASLTKFTGPFTTVITTGIAAATTFGLANKIFNGFSAIIVKSSEGSLKLSEKLISVYESLTKVKQSASQTEKSVRALQLTFNYLVLGATAAVAAYTIFISAYRDNQRRLSDINEEVTTALDKAQEQRLKDLTKYLADDLKARRDSINEQLNQYNKLIAFLNQVSIAGEKVNLDRLTNDIDILKDLSSATDNLTDKFSLLTDTHQELLVAFNQSMNVKDFDTAEKIMDKLKDSAKSYASELRSAFKSLQREIDNFSKDLEDFDLEAKLFGKTDPQKVVILNEQISNLMNTLTQQEGGGNFQDALKTAEKVRKLIDEVQATTKMPKFGGVMPQADLERKIIEKQIDLNKKLKQSLEDLPKPEIEDVVKEFDLKIAGVKKLEEATQALNTQMSQLTREITKVNEELDKLAGDQSREINAYIGNVKQMFENLRFDTFFPTVGEELTRRAGELGLMMPSYMEDLRKIEVLQSKIQDKIKLNFDPKFYQDDLNKLSKLTDDFTKNVLGFMNVTDQEGLKFGSDDESLKVFLETISKQSKTMLENQTKSGELIAQQTRLQGIHTQVTEQFNISNQQLQNTLKQYPVLYDKFVQSTKDSGDVLLTFLDEFKNSLKTLPTLLTLPKPNSNGGLAFASGGMIGGRLGRDNQLIRVHSGEMVINEQSARRYAGPLSAINANMGHSTGGSVVNVDAINVNMPAGAGVDMTPVEIGHALRRELRRGTIRLKG